MQATVNGMAMYACAMASLIAYRQWRGRLHRVLALVAFSVCAFSLLLMTLQRTV